MRGLEPRFIAVRHSRATASRSKHLFPLAAFGLGDTACQQQEQEGTAGQAEFSAAQLAELGQPFTAACREVGERTAVRGDALVELLEARDPRVELEVLLELRLAVLAGDLGDGGVELGAARVEALLGRFVEGADRLRLDRDGMVREITVLARPLSGLSTFLTTIGARFARQRRGDRVGALMRATARPLPATFALLDPVRAP